MALLPIHKKETIMKQNNLLHHLFEAFKNYRQEREMVSANGNLENGRWHRLAHWLMPNGGTLLIALLLVLTQNVWAGPAQIPASAVGPSATTVNYQGRLADPAGNPQTDSFGMTFAVWDAPTGGSIVWGPESHDAVPVSEGLFNVGLGSKTSGGIPTNVWDGDRYLEITVRGETLSPRELIRSVPIAGMAITVPNDSIAADQILDGSISQLEAPSLLEAKGDNHEVRYGNPVVTTDENGNVIIPISPPFSNNVISWVGMNGDWGAYSGIFFTVHTGRGEQNNTQLSAKLIDRDGNALANRTVRINYIAVGE